MEIVLAALSVDVRITGILFFGALAMSLQPASASLLFGKPHDGVLGDDITPSCIVEKLKAILPSKGIWLLPASV